MTDKDKDANETAFRIVREATEEPPRCNKPILMGATVLRCFLEPKHLGPCKGA